MKIHADKIENGIPHSLSVLGVRCILKAIPMEWTIGLSEVRLSNSRDSSPRAIFSRYDHTLTIHSRGSTAAEALKMILSVLAAVHAGYTKRYGHRLSAAQKEQIKNVIQPFFDELLPVVALEKKIFRPVPTTEFHRTA